MRHLLTLANSILRFTLHLMHLWNVVTLEKPDLIVSTMLCAWDPAAELFLGAHTLRAVCCTKALTSSPVELSLRLPILAGIEAAV